ncbi:hypothetical protein [Nostoc sp. CHAB 5715]|nr:hypothetical protein [Nostoc sp. CHAB 5715]MCC5620781.1 hypothetical protein [Nostoc sp. CHAB 5715]
MKIPPTHATCLIAPSAMALVLRAISFAVRNQLLLLRSLAYITNQNY